MPSRTICGPDRKVGRASVFAMAVQSLDGGVRETIVRVESSPYDALTSARARQLAAAILDAADEFDGWARAQ